MDADSPASRSQGNFPVDQPMDALIADHHLVRDLFDRYLNTRDVNAKQDLGPKLLLLLGMHASLEEAVFYPRVRDVDPALVAQCEDEHAQARQLAEQLDQMDEADPQTDQVFRQLADLMFRHIDAEEHKLFPKVQQSGIDLTAIGLEMQAFEASIAAAGGQPSELPGMRQQ